MSKIYISKVVEMPKLVSKLENGTDDLCCISQQ